MGKSRTSGLTKTGAGGNLVDTSYQGKQYNTASGRGVTVNDMYKRLDSLSASVVNDPNVKETITQINKVKNNPDATITMYRATIGNSINKNDWVFLSKAQAEKWTKTPFGTPKPNVKVLEQKVKAKQVDWTGKNLEFVFLG